MNNQTTNNTQQEMKFCVHCGEKILKNAVICPKCGCQVEKLDSTPASAPNIVINNVNQSQSHGYVGTMKNKWVALVLLILFGFLGAHKFYEEKIGMGGVYIFTLAFLGIGLIVDFLTLLFKPVHYYV